MGFLGDIGDAVGDLGSFITDDLVGGFADSLGKASKDEKFWLTLAIAAAATSPMWAPALMNTGGTTVAANTAATKTATDAAAPVVTKAATTSAGAAGAGAGAAGAGAGAAGSSPGFWAGLTGKDMVGYGLMAAPTGLSLLQMRAQKKQFEEQKRLEAAKARYAAWTGIRPQPVQVPNTISPLMVGAGTTGQMWQNMMAQQQQQQNFNAYLEALKQRQIKA